MFIKYYMEESIASFIKELDAMVSSPAKNVCKYINESSPRLENQEADTLHYVVANLLCVVKGGMPDI